MDFTTLVNAIIALLATLITSVVIPWMKTKCDKEQIGKIMAWVEIFASAAEQIYDGPGRGNEKLDYVYDQLAEMGIVVEDNAVRAMIEAQVYKIKKAITE